MSSVERSIDHELGMDDTAETSDLATLSQEEEDRVQMSTIKRMTVEPGLMKLPVSQVASAENSEQWAIDVDHPVEGDLRIFVEKPVTGWSRDYKLVRMLEWYGITNQDPHQLQLCHIYMRKTGDESEYAHGWEAVRPPDYDPPVRVQLREKWGATGIPAYRPDYSNVAMYLFLFVGALAGPLFYGTVPAVLGETWTNFAVSSIVFAAATIVGMIALDK